MLLPSEVHMPYKITAKMDYDIQMDIYRVNLSWYFNNMKHACGWGISAEHITHGETIDYVIDNMLKTSLEHAGFSQQQESYFVTNAVKSLRDVFDNMTLEKVATFSDKSNWLQVSDASKNLPGVDSLVLPHSKCKHYPSDSRQLLWGYIQHLNDHHNMSREQIADWLDELHDSGQINIEFQPWGEEPKEPEEALDLEGLTATFNILVDSFEIMGEQAQQAAVLAKELNSAILVEYDKDVPENMVLFKQDGKVTMSLDISDISKETLNLLLGKETENDKD